MLSNNHCSRETERVLLLLIISPPIPLRLCTMPYLSNPLFLISDIRARWRARMSKIKNGGLDQYGAGPFEQLQQFRTAAWRWRVKRVITTACRLHFIRPATIPLNLYSKRPVTGRPILCSLQIVISATWPTAADNVLDCVCVSLSVTNFVNDISQK